MPGTVHEQALRQNALTPAERFWYEFSGVYHGEHHHISSVKPAYLAHLTVEWASQNVVSDTSSYRIPVRALRLATTRCFSQTFLAETGPLT